MDYLNHLYDPMITSGVVATIVSVAVLALLYKNRAIILTGLEQVRSRLFSRNGFFWTVNVVFMAVSVLHAGVFFGITGNGHDVPGMAQYLGFAVSFFLDLVTVILMQAMLESSYRGEDGRAKQFLFFITVCCGTSTFANLAISLNDFDAGKMLPHAPSWVQTAAPYVLASFPLFVIMMSIAAEMIVNLRPLEKLKEEEYEADEKKRVRILQIRNIYLQRQADEELRALTIRAQMKANKSLRKGNMPNGFRWFWEKPADTEVIIAGVTAQLKAMYEPQIESLKRQVEEMNTNGQTVANTSEPPEVLPPLNDANIEQNPDGIESLMEGQNDTNPDGNSMPESEEIPADKPEEKTVDQSLLTLTKNYPRVASEWLSSNRKTVTIEEIIEITGQSKRRLNKANLRRSTRNPELILISSVIEWLKTAPVKSKIEAQTEDLSADSERVKQMLASAMAPKYSDSDPALSTVTNDHAGQQKETANLKDFPEILV